MPTSPRLLGISLLALATAAGCADDRPTLASLGHRDDVRVEVAVRRDVCQCSCGALICWSFSCSSSAGCSRRDEHRLVVVAGADDDTGAVDETQCLDRVMGIDVALVTEGREPIAPTSIETSCHRIEAVWRGLPAGIDLAAGHRVELADDTAGWTIRDPFAATTATIVAPVSAVSASAEDPATVRTGDMVLVAVTGPALPSSARASLVALAGREARSELDVSVRGAELELRIPEGTPPGAYRLGLDVDTALASDACVGPPTCAGLGTGPHFDLRVE